MMNPLNDNFSVGRLEKPMKLNFRPATLNDADLLVALINRAYRPEQQPEQQDAGWTHESAIIDDSRIQLAQLEAIMQLSQQQLIVAECDHQLVGCVHIMAQQSAVQIGLLTVDPRYQAQHMGKQLLAYAEQQARQCYQPEWFEMSVVHTRHELIAYYERRGYRQSGLIKPYPLDQHVGTPKEALHLLIMHKPA